MSAARRSAKVMRTHPRQMSSRWFPESRYQIAAGRLPRDPVQRLALRLARAGGRARRMGDELFFLLFGRRLSNAMNGDLQGALAHMSAEDFAHARSKLQALATELDHDQRMIERLLEMLTDAERRRLIVLDGGRV